jgi:radical SAM superfamily enzyme YgiQ (UPF0313 family)
MKILGLNPPSKYSRNVARDLLWGCWCKGRRIAGVQFPPLPLIYVGTVLKAKGHEVDVIDAQGAGIPISVIEEKIVNYDIVLIISATMSFDEDANILACLKKKNPRLITIVFGSHSTYLPEEALKRESVDIIVRKEAEFIIRDIVKNLSEGNDKWKGVLGIGYREDGKPVINPDYPYIKNLDELPIPDRSFLHKNLDYYNPIVKRTPWTTALSSRGCPSSCTFCTSPSYYGPVYRGRSPQNVVEELLYLKDLGFREVFYRDELFTVNQKRVMQICNRIITEKVDINWICSVKASTTSYDMLKAMKEAGCRIIRVGVESGVQDILDSIKKNVKLEQVINTFQWANELKLETHAHLMLGLPGETEETIKQTFNFIKKIKPSTVTYGMMTPYPGSKIYNDVLAMDPSYGDGTHINAESIHTNASFSKAFTSVPPEKLEKYVKKGYQKYYMRPQYIFGRLLKIRDLDELRRLMIAGSQVFAFLTLKDK